TQRVLATSPKSSTSRRPGPSRVPISLPPRAGGFSSRSNDGLAHHRWVAPEVCCALHGRPSAAARGRGGRRLIGLDYRTDPPNGASTTSRSRLPSSPRNHGENHVNRSKVSLQAPRGCRHVQPRLVAEPAATR